MKIIYFDSSHRELYNSFIAQNSFDGGFLQSWEWGEFKKRMGSQVQRIGVIDDNNTLHAATTILTLPAARLFKKFYIPRGPVIDRAMVKDSKQMKSVLEFLWQEIDVQARKHKIVFLRTEPDWLRIAVNKELLKNMGFVQGKRHIQTLHTLVVRFDRGMEFLLSNMKQKTRYNIRLAERKGVDAKLFSAKEKIDVFLDLLGKTAKWHNFKSHGQAYYKAMVEQANDDFTSHIAIARYNGVPVAAHLLIQFKDTVYYLMGASDRTYRNLMAPYLLHWESMRALEKNGVRYYDMWGIQSKESNEDKREASWAGFSEFKRGFAPNEATTEYFGVWEKPYRNFLYTLINFFQ